jgi:hypothetical protein
MWELLAEWGGLEAIGFVVDVFGMGDFGFVVAFGFVAFFVLPVPVVGFVVRPLFNSILWNVKLLNRPSFGCAIWRRK